MGKTVFQGSANRKLLYLSVSEFGKITTLQRSCHKQTFITIAPKTLSAQNGEVTVFSFAIFLSCLIFHLLSRTSPRRRRSISMLDASNDMVCDKKVPFEDLTDENIFRGQFTFPEPFKGHFACESKTSDNFSTARDKRKIPKSIHTKSGSRN
jgi:hypothetical protein